MRLRRLTIAGFRGVNSPRTIEFGPRLTVIAAPNSYGKTSISEALEFLFYGSTSKVDKADSKEEYKDSYRNRHFPAGSPAFVEASLSFDGAPDSTLRIELDADGGVRRAVDGKPVDEWPFLQALSIAARPFVLQHALKYLLLVPPVERFQGFARLLGLNAVETTFQALLGLCTKATASLPSDVQRVLAELEAILARLAPLAELKKVSAHIKRGPAGVGDAYAVVEQRVDVLLGVPPVPTERLTRLKAARDAAVAKFYSGDVGLRAFSADEQAQVAALGKALESAIDVGVVEEYGRLSAGETAERLRKEATMLDLGVAFIREAPDTCPLCSQRLTARHRKQITDRHSAAKSEIERATVLEASRTRIERLLKDLRPNLTKHRELLERRTLNLLAAVQPENEPKVRSLFGETNAASLDIVKSAAAVVTTLRDRLREAARLVIEAITACELALTEGTGNPAQVETLGRALSQYLAAAKSHEGGSSQLESPLAGPSRLLRQAVDALAGTAELSLLIDLLEKRPGISRALRVRDVIEGLRDLKKHAEQSLGELMESAMNTDLTASVMQWYSKIKTTGDPDVHFSGFALDRTKTGDFKSRRVAVKAQSYGVELVSAVSSLSESKLNALGLCVSIASALRSPGPCAFLVVDDPIQSWDDEHETQFIEVIRNLVVAEGRQVIVLSHKTQWAKQVCLGCRSVNGVHYEITGYTKDGPRIAEFEWSPIDQRLKEAEALARSPASSSIALQQAEEEIRIIACQLASDLARVLLKRATSPHNMNSKDVRTILNEVGIGSSLVDRVYAACASADDAHHAPKSYRPNAQRIRQALAALHEVKKQAKSP